MAGRFIGSGRGLAKRSSRPNGTGLASSKSTIAPRALPESSRAPHARIAFEPLSLPSVSVAPASLPTPSPPAPSTIIHNFSPGPGPLPQAVLEKAQEEFINWPGAPGMPVFSISHRHTEGPYQRLQNQVAEQVRETLDVPANYQILFMHGGAHGQFSAAPLNLMGRHAAPPGAGGGGGVQCAAVDTGFWARKAADEHSKYLTVGWAASAAESSAERGETATGSAGGAASSASASLDGPERPPRRATRSTAHLDWRDTHGGRHSALPAAAEWRLDARDAFIHVCANETIHGLEYLDDPDADAIDRAWRAALDEADELPGAGAAPRRAPPVVADFTSTLLSRPVDVSRYGVVYCSGGKNLGPAGVTLALVRDDLIDDADALEHPWCPSTLSYRTAARSNSLANTPNTFAVYMIGLVLEHCRARGGVGAAAARARERAAAIYDAIDESRGFYVNEVDAASRSLMSVPFRVRRASSSSSPAGTASGAADDGLNTTSGFDDVESLELEQRFIADAEAAGFRHLAGHPLFGGARASLYEGVPDASVDALVAFMRSFRARYA